MEYRLSLDSLSQGRQIRLEIDEMGRRLVHYIVALILPSILLTCIYLAFNSRALFLATRNKRRLKALQKQHKLEETLKRTYARIPSSAPVLEQIELSL
jgi:Ni,Fe-hydrogenase I cytochrome b subunit